MQTLIQFSQRDFSQKIRFLWNIWSEGNIWSESHIYVRFLPCRTWTQRKFVVIQWSRTLCDNAPILLNNSKHYFSTWSVVVLKYQIFLCNRCWTSCVVSTLLLLSFTQTVLQPPQEYEVAGHCIRMGLFRMSYEKFKLLNNFRKKFEWGMLGITTI